MNDMCGDFQPLRHNKEEEDDEGQKKYSIYSDMLSDVHRSGERLHQSLLFWQ
jgi:hypothetical protein